MYSYTQLKLLVYSQITVLTQHAKWANLQAITKLTYTRLQFDQYMQAHETEQKPLYYGKARLFTNCAFNANFVSRTLQMRNKLQDLY
jgi:hypothetical protein